MKKIACISGATSGIGQATAWRLSKEGYQVIITGRRKARLEALSQEITQQTGQPAMPLAFDIRQRAAVEQAVQQLPAEWLPIDVLVNNAGLARGLSPIQDGNIDDWEEMLDTNVKGLLYLSRAIMPMMKERQHGHIVNIGSTAGKEVYPKGNVYTASKHAVDAISKAMRMDLLPFGIRVTQVCPGLVETEFSKVRFHGDTARAEQVYEGFEALRPEDIADLVAFAVSRPAHVNINDLVVMPTAQASSTLVHKKTE